MTHAHRQPQPDASHKARSSTTRPGFTLTEAAVLVAGLALGAALLAPTLGAMRTEARLAGSRDNLRQLGEAHAAYSDANSGFIAGFDWEAAQGSGGFGGPQPVIYDIGCGTQIASNDNLEAAKFQLGALLRKATGRCGQIDPDLMIIPNLDLVPHRRFGHIPMLDWLGASPTDSIVVSPLDTHQTDFQSWTTVDEYPDLPGGDPDLSFGGFRDSQSVRLWPYASSYQTTTYAFSSGRPSSNGSLAIEPTEDATQHLVIDAQGYRPQLRQSVRYPANKALLFEEFDYSQGLGNQARYYADPLASVNILAFDGSARRIATADANPGWDPANFRDMDATPELRYRSIDTRYFPDDTDRPDPYPGYYKWTRGGLEGIDFGAGEINTTEW